MWGKGVGGECGAHAVHTCENGKMRPGETTPGMGERDKGK
jgi:hypothetical protein